MLFLKKILKINMRRILRKIQCIMLRVQLTTKVCQHF